MAKEAEACASVHLSLDQLGFGVHSFCSSIVEREGECGVHGGPVEFKSAGEGVQVGQILAPGLVDPAAQALIVVGVGCE